MTDIGPGDLVVCVDDTQPPPYEWPDHTPPVHQGMIYTVRDVERTIDGFPGVRLEETAYNCFWGDDIPLFIGRFRPIRKPSIEVLRRAVEDIPAEVWE